MWFQRQKIASQKNGQIDLVYSFGQPAVFVDGYDQSTAYIKTMWRRALRRVPKPGITKVLMLGLGGGSAVGELQRRFPGCDITVVEWDPAMIGLYHTLHPTHQPIHILAGDAMRIVPALEDTFELVIVDLFKGNQTPPELARKPMISAIAQVVAPTGYCLLNVFESLELLGRFDDELLRVQVWRYKYNQLALYRRLSTVQNSAGTWA